MRPSASQKTWLGGLAERYHQSLDDRTASYLDARGIGPDAARGFLLGLVVEADPAHAQYEGRLSIPFLTPTGVVSMRFRCLADHACKDHKHGKYLGMSGEDTRLFNVQALHDAGSEVAIIEGELDALVSTVSGLPAVGASGVNNWKPYYYRLFEDYERVVVIGDGDTAGREFVGSLSSHMSNSIRRPMPEGQDVNSYVLAHGADAFLAYVE